MKKLVLIIACAIGTAAFGQCGCGQQIPKPGKGLITANIPDTGGGQAIEKGKKKDGLSILATNFNPGTGGAKMPQEKKLALFGYCPKDPGSEPPKNIPDHKQYIPFCDVYDTGGVKLPPDGKKHDHSLADTSIATANFRMEFDIDTGGTLPGGAGKKHDLANTTDTGGHGQMIEPGKKRDDYAANDTGGQGQSIDTGKKYDVAVSESGGGIVGTGAGKKYDFASLETGGTGGVKLPPDGKKLDVAQSGGTGIGTGTTGSSSDKKRLDFVDTGGVITGDKGSKKPGYADASGGTGGLSSGSGGLGKKQDFSESANL